MSSEKNEYMSDNTREIIDIASNAFLCSIIAIFGIATNLISIVVFRRQGMGSTVNISLTARSVADLGSLLTLLWFNLCMNPLFLNAGMPVVFSEIQHVSAGWPHGCFVRIAGWIAAYITLEKCLCVATPMKVKQIITKRTTLVSIALIYGVITLSLLPEYTSTYISWKFYPTQNESLLGVIFPEDRAKNEGIITALYSIYLLASFLAILVFTAVLVAEISLRSEWRKSTTSDRNQADVISRRERKVVLMVLLVAVGQIVCLLPFVVLNIIELAIEEFNILGRFSNIYFVCWSLAFLLGAINSSLGLFIYYKMSTKFRHTFRQVFHLNQHVNNHSS